MAEKVSGFARQTSPGGMIDSLRAGLRTVGTVPRLRRPCIQTVAAWLGRYQDDWYPLRTGEVSLRPLLAAVAFWGSDITHDCVVQGLYDNLQEVASLFNPSQDDIAYLRQALQVVHMRVDFQHICDDRHVSLVDPVDWLTWLGRVDRLLDNHCRAMSGRLSWPMTQETVDDLVLVERCVRANLMLDAFGPRPGKLLLAPAANLLGPVPGFVREMALDIAHGDRSLFPILADVLDEMQLPNWFGSHARQGEDVHVLPGCWLLDLLVDGQWPLPSPC